MQQEGLGASVPPRNQLFMSLKGELYKSFPLGLAHPLKKIVTVIS